MSSTLIKSNTKLEFEDIKKIYTSGFKNKTDLKVGIEYERLPVYDDSYCAASYYNQNGICEFLRAFARKENWDYITDNLDIIGLKQGHTTITLEPGCQTEFSIEPKNSISELKAKIDELDSKIIPVLNNFGIKFLNYGISPVSTYKNIKLIPKKRYHIMANYLWGILSDVMMRETAGIQGTFDFTSEEDCIEKFKIANMLSPFMTALFANSPIRGGVDTGYKSFRALSWLNTDNDRCGFCCNFDNNYSFDEYIDYIMNIPMLFIARDNEEIVIDGKISFKEFMDSGFNNHIANIDDYLLQANLAFPEVRIRNFIEVRNHDCGNKESIYAMLAIYKGILYNKSAREKVLSLFKNRKFNEFAELRYNIPRYATESLFNGAKIKDYIKEIVNIAKISLKEQSNNEEKYIEPIESLVTEGISPADIILKNWYGSWDKDINKLIKYISE